MKFLALAGGVDRHDQRELMFVEQAKPLVPLDQIIAAGIGRPLGLVLILVAVFAEHQPEHRLHAGRG